MMARQVPFSVFSSCASIVKSGIVRHPKRGSSIMHEIRVTVPPEQVAETASLAHEAGIDRVSVTDVYVHGPDVHRRMVSVETSTPKARRFVEALLASNTLAMSDYSFTSRELRAIADRSDLAELTQPMREPFPDVVQDLW